MPAPAEQQISLGCQLKQTSRVLFEGFLLFRKFLTACYEVLKYDMHLQTMLRLHGATWRDQSEPGAFSFSAFSWRCSCPISEALGTGSSKRLHLAQRRFFSRLVGWPGTSVHSVHRGLGLRQAAEDQLRCRLERRPAD